ncbi:MAG: acetyl-CoA carboxylase biotin carboxylase subunit [Alphaproteobacteria bacterium]|nr:acetyl-CoA carboxylase biotin carboxylase subunit [Alphaproteobacteria bacterium]
MFRKVLIANRGEIALRIIRACRDLGVKTVAVHSTADDSAMHVRLADESVCIGKPPSNESYMSMPAIISAATITKADAIHPGFGFLSENADFAQMVEDHQMVFIGPTAEHINMMGDKIIAKRTVKDLGIPVVPGSDGEVRDIIKAKKACEEIGYPVLLKATAGGGGRGMQLVESADKLQEALQKCQQEAKMAFGNDAVYIEKYLTLPRHIEIQVVGDGRGKVLHFWERDCSLQRRHQKVLEEAPSPALNDEQRTKICNTVVEALAKIKYRGAGTVEFLYENGEFYFIEMNTRIQVEHPVTEMITGVDLVQMQIKVAAGEPLTLEQKDIKINGHAIECRINAEDPDNFLPSPGKVTGYHPPGGPGVRVDSAIYTDYSIPPHYDSMIAKLITHNSDREQCIRRMNSALYEYLIDGIKCNIPLQQRIIAEDDFIKGDYNIHWLEKWMKLK